MSRLFQWAAPWFAREARRWNEDDALAIARELQPLPTANGRILDLGGGTGRLGSLLASATARAVTVLDASDRMLSYGSGLPGIERVQGDAGSLPFESASFDAAVAVDVVHHLERQSDALVELARVLRPGGAVFVAESDPSLLVVRMSAALERALGEPGAFLRPQALAEMFAAAGFDGAIRRERGPSYAFVGRLRDR